MSHVTTRKGASSDEKDKRLSDNSPVQDMKKKVAANAEKEKMAVEKQNGGEKPAEKKDKQPEKSDKKDSKHNGEKQPDKASKSSEKQNGDKQKDKPVEKPAEKKEKAAEKPADKKETEKAKEDSTKGEKSAKPEQAKPKPATPAKAEKPAQNGSRHNGVSDVTLSTNGGSDVTLPATVSGDSDSEDMVIVIDDQENDELFPELTYDDTSDVEGFENQDGFRSATRRSQAKVTRTPETPRPASDRQSEAPATAAAAASYSEAKEKVSDAPKEATKVLKLKDDPSSASERKLRSTDSPKKQTEKAAESPKKPSEAKSDEEDIVVIEEAENSQDGEARKPDTNFSKSRVKVSPYRRSMRLADQTTSSANATYTGNNTTMEMDITESSYSEQQLDSSHVSALRGIRGRRSYKPEQELTLRTVTRRPPTMPLIGAEQPLRPTGTVVGRKRKPDASDGPEPAVDAEAVHAKRLRLLDKLMSPFRRALPSSTPLPARRAAPIVGINSDLPLSAPVAAEPFEPEALKNVPTAAQPGAQSAHLAQDPLVIGAGDEASKRCIIM